MKKLITITSLALAVLLFFLFIDFIGIGGKSVTVSIPQGADAKQIVSLLKENGVIHFPFLFVRYISHDSAHLKAGVHIFEKRMGYKEALEELKKDAPLENTVTLTIPEGYEAREIGALLEENKIISAEEFEKACYKAHERFSFLPKDGNVEGYLFPATYAFQRDAGADTVVDMMLQTFEDVMYTPENISRCEELGLAFHEVLTLASVIEREVAFDTERAVVSSVFYNRLKEGMRLESCATVQYVLKERKNVLSVADTKIDSPYNTYLHPGLPPAPIASPGIKSLHAALYPDETEYLFFVANGTGGHTFSKTYDEHLIAANSN